jgi:peptidoglycan/LPS O-acetylase OafA/YrhL
MGTMREWVWVSFGAIFWGGFMLLWTAHKRRKAQIKPVVLFKDVLGWALMGLWFGLVTTFNWQAFHWPLILATVLTFAGSVIVFCTSTNRKIQSAE